MGGGWIKQERKATWACQYIKKPDEYWQRVIFTDECKIQSNPNKQRLWLHAEREVSPTERDRWQDSVLIWGSNISLWKIHNRNDWRNNECQNLCRYFKEKTFKELSHSTTWFPKVSGFLAFNFSAWWGKFSSALIVNDYFKERNTGILSWPTKSPDINLIESVWAQLKGKLKRPYKDLQ